MRTDRQEKKYNGPNLEARKTMYANPFQVKNAKVLRIDNVNYINSWADILSQRAHDNIIFSSTNVNIDNIMAWKRNCWGK